MDAADRATQTGVQRATGRGRDEWFDLLDDWGAPDCEYHEIARWLTGEHEISRWWAQKLIVEYQQARGLREPGVRSDGTFTVTASKTVAVGVERLFGAFVDADVRRQWLPAVELHERTTQTGRSARFDWPDNGTRVNVTFTASGDAKSQVGVEHEHLPDARTAEAMKAYWRERLAILKDVLEG